LSSRITHAWIDLSILLGLAKNKHLLAIKHENMEE